MRLESTVERELEAIREELARTKLSSSTVNIVVWIDDDSRREWVLERAALLGEKHPSFMLIFDRSGATEAATVVTSDRDVLSHFTVQGERVIIDADDFAPETVAEFVHALCPSTVETILWWTSGRLSEEPSFGALVPLATSVVFDSGGATPDATTIAAVAAFRDANPAKLVRDLAWLRLAPWQDMIAHFFDDPNLVDELFAIKEVRINSGSDAEALYLAGWLASRLGWKAAGHDAFVDRNGTKIAYTHAREGDMRRIRSVSLISRTSAYHGAVSDDPNVVRVWVEGDNARDPRLFTLQALDNASLLERAMLERGDDAVFDTALHSAGTLAG
jgi:glucose-6-phosphate dehydrogenase assembly protein OpcA